MGITKQTIVQYSNITMLLKTTLLLAIILGILPSLDSGIDIRRKVVPALILLLILANIDWKEAELWFFVISTITTHAIFFADVPNRVVNHIWTQVEQLWLEKWNSEETETDDSHVNE